MDRAWWDSHIVEVRASGFAGELATSSNSCKKHGIPQLKYNGQPMPTRNSGAGAILMAKMACASRIILLGYDCQKTHGKAHWHGNHPAGLGNAGALPKWQAQFRDLKHLLGDTEVINCSRETALEMFPRAELKNTLPAKPALIIEGMHGLGDNLHQRSVIRQLMDTHDIWLETPWPCLYHDMDIKLVSKSSRLRTQAKNAGRESAKFTRQPLPQARRLKVGYSHDQIRQRGSIFAAMSAKCGVKPDDFRLPIPDDWLERADALLDSLNPQLPVLIYRPLVERTEWGGCRNRNPEHGAYAKLFEAIRQDYFVISVADLVPGKEWIVGKRIDAAAEFHAGELDIEIMAALFRRAALIYSAPGFAPILAKSVEVPSVTIFGGHEDAASADDGMEFAPSLSIEPVRPCRCFSQTHRCDKRIDIPRAKARLLEFVNDHYPQPRIDQAQAA